MALSNLPSGPKTYTIDELKSFNAMSDTAAFLINKDGHIVAAMHVTQAVGQRADLRSILDIAFEQDISCWFDIAKQPNFVIRQGQTR